MAALSAKSWSEDEICHLILREVSQGGTMQRLNEMSQAQVSATQTGFADTLRAFEIQAGQITVQVREIKRAKEEVQGILADGCAFVAQTQADFLNTKNEMIQQLDAIHTKQQDIVRLVVACLWLEEVLSLETVPVTVIRIQERLDTLTGQVDHRMTHLTNEIAATRAAISSSDFGFGFSTGKGGAAQTARDRNVFDPRDYKVAELGNKPSMAKWKKWFRDFECFVDTIGPSWKGTSGLLRQLRFHEQPFDNSQLSGTAADTRKRNDKAPQEHEYEFDAKTDVLYRLIMPKLDGVMSAEFSQSGDETGFELFRQLSRKIGPPRVDVKFDLKAEIEGLGKHSCSNLAQTARFLAMLDQRVWEYIF